MIMSAEVDEMLEWFAEMFQREPDYTFVVPASTAAGTVIATGIPGACWHAKYGGAELGQFTLVGGQLAVGAGVTLTGSNFKKMFIADTGLIINIDVQ